MDILDDDRKALATRRDMEEKLDPIHFSEKAATLQKPLTKKAKSYPEIPDTPIDSQTSTEDITALRTANRLLPIGRLPTEVLTLIFTYGLARVKPSNYYRRLCRFMSVSWHWAEVIKGYPALWSVIMTSCSRRLMAEALTRSNKMPLTITRYNINCYHHIHRQCDELLLGSSERWRSADIVMPGRPFSFSGRMPWLRAPVPELEEFTIACHGKYRNRLDNGGVELFQGNAPKLRSLRVVRFPVKWTSPIFRQLTKLSLRHVDTGDLSETELCDMLNQCSSLQVLELAYLDRPPPASGRKHQDIKLPELISLTFIDLWQGEVQSLLPHIDAPSCTHLKIFLDVVSEDCLTYLPFSTYAKFKPKVHARHEDCTEPWLKRMVDMAKKAKIVLCYHDDADLLLNSIRFMTWNENGDTGLDMQMDDISPEISMLQWLASLFERQLVNIPLTLKICGCNATNLDFSVLDKFPSITELILDDAVVDLGPHPLLSYLGRWTFGAQGKATWPLPNLRKFSTARSPAITARQLLDVVQSRYHGPAKTLHDYLPTTKRGVVERPVPFESIDIRHIADKRLDDPQVATFLEEVRQIVGKEVLRWAVLPKGAFDAPGDDEDFEWFDYSDEEEVELRREMYDNEDDWMRKQRRTQLAKE